MISLFGATLKEYVSKKKSKNIRVTTFRNRKHYTINLFLIISKFDY